MLPRLMGKHLADAKLLHVSEVQDEFAPQIFAKQLDETQIFNTFQCQDYKVIQMKVTCHHLTCMLEIRRQGTCC